MSGRDSRRPAHPDRRPVRARWRVAAADQGRRLLRTLRVGRPPSERPLPKVRLALGGWVPGWLLRIAVGAVAVACVALLPVGPRTLVVAALGALVLVARPSGLAAAVFAVAIGFRLALTSTTPFAGRSYLLLLGVHLLVQLARLVGNLPWSARVDLRVLVSPARRFLPVQAFAQLLALAAALLSSASVTVPILPVAGGIGLTLLAWLLLSGLTGPAAQPRGWDDADRSDG